MPQNKEVHKEYMRKRRGSQKGSQSDEVHTQSSHRVLYLAKALIDPIKRGKLIQISTALNKETTGLDGRRVNLGPQVRYGINGFTLSEIRELLQ